MVIQWKEIWSIKSDLVQGKTFFKNQARHLVYPSVSVFIPVAPKDYWIVSKCVQSLRLNLLNPISELIICGKQSLQLDKICAELGCVFVDESAIAPILREDLDRYFNHLDRTSWIFQQLLKLSSIDVVSEENSLVWDSDTCLVRKVGFVVNEKYVLEYGQRKHIPYLSSSQALLGKLPTFDFAFTCHKMLFNKKYLAEMKEMIEKRFQKSWYEAYLGVVDTNEVSSISEYGTYSLFFLRDHPEKIILRNWRNLGESSYGSNFRRKLLSLWFVSISYHAYSQDIV